MAQKPHSTPIPSKEAALVLSVRSLLFAVAFIEGAAVMAVELAGAKMIAPFYGTSLYVWSSVLAVTLGGLTLGYYTGGWATTRFTAGRLLFWELLAAAFFTALLPIVGLKVAPLTMDLGVRAGSLMLALVCMGPILMSLGMVSPTIIQLTNDSVQNTGKSSGSVYAISTLGGIFMTLMVGFYLLPEWGIKKTMYLTALMLFINALVVGGLYKQSRLLAMLFFMLSFIGFYAADRNFTEPSLKLQYLYRSEGLLGQLSVLQNPDPETGKTYRHLFINHIAQTWVDEKFVPFSEWNYPHRLATLASVLPQKKTALLIGLGGGSIAMECKEQGFKLDIVEMDERVPKLAEKYFGFEPKETNIIIDDGRHYINQCKNKYDLIVIDVLNGEVQPHHLFTIESLSRVKSILSDKGLLLINNQGFLAGPHGRASRSLFKTLQEIGFKVQYFQSNNEGSGDVHFMASKENIDFHQINEEEMNPCCRYMPHNHENLVTDSPLDLEDAVVLTDDKPLFELWNQYSNETWRETALGAIIKREKENQIPFFK